MADLKVARSRGGVARVLIAQIERCIIKLENKPKMLNMT